MHRKLASALGIGLLVGVMAVGTASAATSADCPGGGGQFQYGGPRRLARAAGLATRTRSEIGIRIGSTRISSWAPWSRRRLRRRPGPELRSRPRIRRRPVSATATASATGQADQQQTQTRAQDGSGSGQQGRVACPHQGGPLATASAGVHEDQAVATRPFGLRRHRAFMP